MGFRKSTTMATVAVVAAAILLAGCATGGSSSPTSAPNKNAVLNVGVASIVQKWDPHSQDWGGYMQPLQAVYDTLLRENTDGTFSAALATKWSYTSPTTFEFTLRSGVKFSDGTPLNSSVVLANFASAQKQLGPKTPLIAGWTEKALNANTVQIKLPAPQPDVPLILSQNQGMMVSGKALKDEASLNQNPVGAGPYTLDASATVANSQYTFVKNPTYWDAKNQGFSKIVFKIYTDSTAEFNAMKSGQIDAMSGDNTTATSATASGFKVQSWLNYFMGLSLQGQDLAAYPFLKNVKVRQALQYAVDRKELQLTLGAGQPTTQIFPPGTEGYDKKLDSQYPYNPTKAKQLLTEAGYPNGITFTAQSVAFGYFPRYMQVLQAQLAKSGIKLLINNVQPAQYIGDRNGADNPVYAWYYNPVNAYYDAAQVLIPNGGFNPFHITDPTMISLFNKAAAETNVAQRTQTFQQLSARYVSQAYHLITNFGDAYYYYNPKVISNWKPTVLQALPQMYDLQPAS